MPWSISGVQLLNTFLYAVNVGVQGIISYGVIRCSSIAASAVTGLNVEPGG